MISPSNTSLIVVLKRTLLEKKLKLSRSAIYARLNPNSRIFDASFPRPIRYTRGRGVYWIEAEVDAWLETQLAASRAKENPSLAFASN